MNSRRKFLGKAGGALAAFAIPGYASADDGSDKRPSWPIRHAADDLDFWRQVRALYPLTHERAYLNTGGLGPSPFPVIDRAYQTMLDLQRRSEHGHSMIMEAREPVAEFLGADHGEIAFTRNATEGNSTVASGLQLNSGDEVIFEAHAHPGGAVPWLNRAKRDGIKVRLFEPDPDSADTNLERIEAQITDRTRVIQVSHVTAPTGIKMPVERIRELAHDRGIWFHIDGAQSAGMFPFDLHQIGCDSYATSCHKWMCAPVGTGVIYVMADRLDEVYPTEVGSYTGPYKLPDTFEYDETAQRFESGTRDATSIVGLAAATEFLNEIGLERVAVRNRSLAKYLQAGLSEIPEVTILSPAGDELGAPMTTYKIDGVPYDVLSSFLHDEYQLRCRVVSERGLDALRVSTHIFNFEHECDRVVEGTRAAIQTLR
jgi:selenocysteine lyase/cysteine desulfurase